MKKRIALIYGGRGEEHGVSLMGYPYLSSLFGESKYELTPVLIDRSGKWYIERDGRKVDTFPIRIGDGCGLLTDGGILPIDCAFPLLHGVGGEDGCVQGALECAGIPYVGENTLTSAVCFDKAYTKSVAVSFGIPTADFTLIKSGSSPEQGADECEENLGYPIFVKPTRQGSSVGACAVYGRDSLIRALKEAMKYGDVLAERLITPKRELELAFIRYDSETVITYPSEIVCHGTYGYTEKYSGTTRTLLRAGISVCAYERLKEYSLRLIRALDVRVMSRIDFFLSGEEIYFNEINTMPGFTPESMYLKMIEAHGIAPKDAIDTLILHACGGRE